MKEWELSVVNLDGEVHHISFHDLEQWKDVTIPVEDYVPRKQAEAVYLQQIFKQCSLPWDYSHALFIAEDGFEQKVKRDELGNAFFVFKQKGEPLVKGFPVRLYVPSKESDCLNVKSVVCVQLFNN